MFFENPDDAVELERMGFELYCPHCRSELTEIVVSEMPNLGVKTFATRYQCGGKAEYGELSAVLESQPQLFTFGQVVALLNFTCGKSKNLS